MELTVNQLLDESSIHPFIHFIWYLMMQCEPHTSHFLMNQCDRDVVGNSLPSWDSFLVTYFCLVLWEFHIMYFIPTYIPVTPYQPSNLVFSLWKKMKNKNKTVYLSSLHKDPLLYQLQPPLTSATAAASPVLLCVDHSVPPSFLPLHHVFTHRRGTGSWSVSHNILFGPNSFTCRCSLHFVIGLVQGFRLLLHHQYWTLIETALRYPAVALNHEILWLWFFRAGSFTCSSSS